MTVRKPFDSKVGIIGGGQLGKMLIESCGAWNVAFNILENDKNAPSIRYADKFIKGRLIDSKAILELASCSDVITYEIEHVDVKTLKALEKKSKIVIPSADVLATIQDKGIQKNFYKKHAIPTSPFEVCKSKKEIKACLNNFEGDQIVIKSCTDGYDGKGVVITDRLSFNESTIFFNGPCLVEQFIDKAVEVSVIVARNTKGETKTYPISEMVFDEKLNLVDYLFAPSILTEALRLKIENIALRAIKSIEGVGLFAVELFVRKETEEVWVNEIAPRPHNSGHHTIESCLCSQYEQLMRVLLDLPLGNTDLKSPVVMINIIGPNNLTGDYILEGLDELLAIEGVFFNWYNKEVTKPGRKMGHITVLRNTVSEALKIAKHCRNILIIK